MKVTWGLLAVLSLVCRTEPRCSPTSYYKNCWIRRFPGLFIDIAESQRRGAQLLKQYQEETALKCSRTCCLTRNFSCNLAIFHYDSTQENCFHLHCPTLESCILSHRGNVVLYNITKGVDPDLLVFGKYFTSNVRVLPHHYSRVNASDPLTSDKRQFVHPPPPAVLPLTAAPTGRLPSTVSRAHTTTAATSATEPRGSTRSATISTATTAPFSTEGTPTASRVSTPISTTAATSFPTSSTTSTATVGLLHADTLATTATPAAASTGTHLHSTLPESASTLSVPATLVSSVESTKQNPNDTKGSLGRNHSAGGDEVDADATTEGAGPGWHVAANTLLVAVAIFISVLLSCCCSVLLVVSWRGQRKRMGRYRTSWRGKKGSMRLIKYVLVRESS